MKSEFSICLKRYGWYFFVLDNCRIIWSNMLLVFHYNVVLYSAAFTCGSNNIQLTRKHTSHYCAELSCLRWTLLEIRPDFIPLCLFPQFYCFRQLSSRHLFFIIMTLFSLLTANIDRWMDEVLKEFTGEQIDVWRKRHVCTCVLCFPVFHTYIFEYNSTKGEQKRKLQNNILRKTSQDGKLQRER